MQTTKTAEKLKVTIKRPSGEMETVYKTDNVRYIGNNKEAQQYCIKATRDAGKGDILSFEIVEEQVPMSLEEQREHLVWSILGLEEAQDAARERDYDYDIGFHGSVKYDAQITDARAELSAFDEAHPEIVAEIKRKEAIRDEQLIQSALNA